MKKLAARDFEDILQVILILVPPRGSLLTHSEPQCSIPCFEGLLDEPHNRHMMDLLYELATWHALAKLRLHTEHTLDFFDQVTRNLGLLMRKFLNVTCSAFDTKELPSEEAARGRREAAIAQKTPSQPDAVPSQKPTGAKPKLLNLATYKVHALGDYPSTIRKFGTTDSYTSQVVCPLATTLPCDPSELTKSRPQGEVEHKFSKRNYDRTNKQEFTGQLASQEARERVVSQSRTELGLDKPTPKVDRRRKAPQPATVLNDPLPYTQPTAHHHISESTRNWHGISQWLTERAGDRAVKVGAPSL